MKSKKITKFISALLAASMMLTVPATVSAYYDPDIDYDAVDYDYAVEEIPLEEAYSYSSKSFSANLKPELTAELDSRGVFLNWNTVNGASKYKVYRYDEKSGKYAYLGDASWSLAHDTDVKENTTYKYKVKAFNKSGESTQYSNEVTITVPLLPTPANVYLTSNKVTLKWTKNKKADGYEVWYYKRKLSSSEKDNSFYSVGGDHTYSYIGDSFSEYDLENVTFKKLKTTESTSYSFKRDKNYGYYFKLRSYYIKDGKKVYSAFSDYTMTTRSDALMNGAKGKTKTSVKMVSYRSDVKDGTITYSEADKKIMDKFAKEHFTSNMTPFEKAEYLSTYIHDNVKYATTSSELNKIGGVSPTKAIFEYKLGQCYQYNAAFMLFLAYLGYDVRLIASHRYSASSGNKISHYWGEITLEGKKFILDAGNTKDGLYFFCVPYENEPGNYIRNK